MTWTKLSDDFSDDCEVLDDDAFRLHVEGLNWSNRKLLDCLIPKDHLRRFATHPDAVLKLVDAGWWEDRGDHYEVIHHAGYQYTRESTLARQRRSRENGAKGGRPQGPPHEQPPRKRANNPPGLASGLATGLSEIGQTPRSKPSQAPQQPTQRGRHGEVVNVTTYTEGRTMCTKCRRLPVAGNLEYPGLCGACITREREGLERKAVQFVRDGYDR